MNNDKADFQRFFQTNNSSSNNLHYDLVAEKFMTGIENHTRKQYNNSSSHSCSLGLIGAILQIIIGLVVMIFAIFRYIVKSPK